MLGGMPLRLGIPVTIILLIGCLFLSYALNVGMYWPLVVVMTVLSLREANELELRQYQTMFALPPVGLAAVLLLAWPIAFPWFLRIRHRILTERLPRGTAPVGKGAYALAGLVGVASLWSTWQTSRFLRSPALADMQSVAQDVARACAIDLNVQRAPDRLVITVFGDIGTAPQALIRPFARRIARLAWERHPAHDSLRATDVVFRETSKRGDVVVRRDYARYGWWSSEFTVDAENPDLNAADDALARAALDRLFHADTLGFRRVGLHPKFPALSALDPALALLREHQMLGTLDSVVGTPCRTFHAEDGGRLRGYDAWRGGRQVLVNFTVQTVDGRSVIVNFVVTPRTASDSL